MRDPQPLPDQRIGWKVMRTNSEGTEFISGADSRIRFPIRLGKTITMPHPGVWMSLDKDYVLEHYRCHDFEALVCLSFDPDMVCDGNLTDRQTEFAVPSVTLLSCEPLPPEE
jgi:hypothetical protein